MRNFKLRDFNDKKTNNYKLVKTEFAGTIFPGSPVANNLYGSYLSSNRVENRYDPNVKLMVLVKGANKEKNDSITNTITEWFYEESNTNIYSIEFKDDLSSVVKSVKELATNPRFGDSRTALGFVIGNEYGDIVIYNVGDLKHYIKFGEDDIFDVTFLSPDSGFFDALETNYGVYYYYSNVEEAYLVQEEIEETDIELASSQSISASEIVDAISSSGNYLYGKYADVDRAINVLKLRKKIV